MVQAEVKVDRATAAMLVLAEMEVQEELMDHLFLPNCQEQVALTTSMQLLQPGQYYSSWVVLQAYYYKNI